MEWDGRPAQPMTIGFAQDQIFQMVNLRASANPFSLLSTTFYCLLSSEPSHAGERFLYLPFLQRPQPAQ